MALPSIGGSETISETLANFADDRHRVGPLLHLACQCENGMSASTNAASILRLSHQNNVYASLRQKAAEKKIVNLFCSNAVAFSFLKGRGLAKQLHDNPTARRSKDIDILITPDSATHTIKLLRDEGYIYKPNTLRRKQIFESVRQNFDMYIHKDLTFIDPQYSVPIELHRRLFKFEPKSLTTNFISSISFSPNPSLSNSYYCLYLILHGAIASWSRLKWVIDLSIIARIMPNSDRLEMLDIAKLYGCERAIASSLFMIEDFFSGSLDKEWHLLLKPYKQDREAHKMKQLFYKCLVDETANNVSLPLKNHMLSGPAGLIFQKKIGVFHSLFIRWSASLSIRI